MKTTYNKTEINSSHTITRRKPKRETKDRETRKKITNEKRRKV